MVTEMAEGRFGVLGTEALDIPRLVAAIEALVKLAPVGGGIRVRGQQLDLATHPTDEGYSGRATRALRYALACFAKNGLTGLADAGFRDGLEGFLATTAQRAAALGARIAGRRFRLVYQPVVNLSDRAVHHFEALIRPLADLDGLALSPQNFVTYAEAINLSEPLDLAIVSEVRATLAAAPREVRVAANISGLSMQSASFRDQLMAQVPRDGRLLVELTETADITDTDAAAATIAALRQAQVEVGIDDFGAGSASFRYVRDFRVDHVKIDGSYVRAATQGARERGLVASMRDLAHGLGADTIAEMIETEETAGLMRELGVTFGQGYLFGRAGRLPGSRRD
jgi:EAL domain-containing protein (putative c-di-GMP-specific phosphodiesterase class I)